MKTRLTYILLATALAVVIPIASYWWNFKSQPISNMSADWGTFGDFIGGTINTVVGIVSLIVLTWITLIVAKNSNEESRKQQIILKRMDAYRAIADYVPKFNLLSPRIKMHTRYISNLAKYPESVSAIDFANTMLNLQKEFHVFAEMRETIRSFPVCYGYLFNYDFQSAAFKKLLKSSQATLDGFSEIESSIINAHEYNYDETVDPSNEFLDDLTDFVNALLEELDFE